jgi:hypothetical protein
MIRAILTASALAVVATSSGALEMTQVPPHVAEVAKHYAPGAKWETVGTDFDAQLGEAEYEIKGKMENGTVIEVDVSPEGKIHEIETVIHAGDVPAPVTKLMSAYLPGFSPTLVEKSARPDGVTFYEFEGKMNGRDIDVEVNAAGTEIIIGDDAAI